MESSSVSDSGLQQTTIANNSASGSPAAPGVTRVTPPNVVASMQPAAAATASSTPMDTSSSNSSVTTVGQQIAMAQVSVPQAFVMAPQGTVTSSETGGQQLMMQPPAMSVPLMMSQQQYQMIVPAQGLVDQHGHLIQQAAAGASSTTEAGGSPAPASPAVDGRAGSRSATPQQAQATALYQQQHLVQLKDGQIVKSDGEAVPSPIRQGSVGSGGSPAPPTPGSLGSSPLPQLMSGDGMPPPHLPAAVQQQALAAGINITQNAVATGTPPPAVVEVKEEKVDISKLKPPKKPLTPYMRFSKAIWQQVKAANSSMSVCEIGATIGRMWRELADTEKQKYNEDFAADKISYDVELQNYLKITGLQASDLVKNRPKKKVSHKSSDDSKSSKSKASSRADPSPQSTPPVDNTMATAAATVQQVSMPGQQLVGVQNVVHPNLTANGPVSIQNNQPAAGTAALPQQVLSGAALSGLPHFSQVWTGQQGANIISQGMQAGGQEQLIVQQQGANGQPQQVLINALGLPAGTVVNGSTGQVAAGDVISHPILIQPTGEQATQLFSTETVEGQKTDAADPSSASHTAAAAPAQLLWHQVMSANPSDLQHQQNVLNLLNMAAAQSGVQPDQLSQAAQIAGLQPPLNIQQVSVSASAAPAPSESQAQDSHGQAAVHLEAAQSQAAAQNTVLVDQNGTPVLQTVSNGPNNAAGANTSQAVVTLPPTAQNLYNSYGFNPWSGFPQQLVQTAGAGETTQENVVAAGDGTTATITTQGGIQVVYNRESILETELQHLRSALSEKTKEVQRLTQDLEKAYSIIEQLKQQNPTAVIHLPAPQEVPATATTAQVLEAVTTAQATTSST